MYHIKEWLAGDQIRDLIDTNFAFNLPFGPWFYIGLTVIALLLLFFYYYPRLELIKTSFRYGLFALRTFVLLLIFFLLLDPLIVGKLIEPADQYVILLFDDSKSMQIYGDDGLSRGQRLQQIYKQSSTDFKERLQKKYKVARYRFGGDIDALQTPQLLTFSQPQTDIVHSIEATLQELDELSISGIVLFSDGIQQTAEKTAQTVNSLSTSVPVFCVGVDLESDWRDMQIERLSVNRTPFDKSPVVLNIGTKATGFKGRNALVEVVDGQKVVCSKSIGITSDLQLNQVRLEFVPQHPGWLDYQARIRLAGSKPGNNTSVDQIVSTPEIERVLQNNAKQFVIDNNQKTFRILYYSGKPNWQHKFIRQALVDDEQLKLSSLILMSRAEQKFVFRGSRTSMTNPLFKGFENNQEKFGRYDEPVYLRLGMKESELVKGFPNQAEELFPYHLIILGEMTEEDFTAKQLELTRDFVDKRGGALLVMGGPNSFVADQFAGSVFETMLPVTLLEKGKGTSTFVEEIFQAVPANEGELTGTFSLDSDPNQNLTHWRSLPYLYGLNLFAFTRAGAAILSRSSQTEEEFNNQPLFVVQRYGNGQCAVLATGETWQWQLQMPKEDNTHERFWRQVVRYLVRDVPEQISFTSFTDDSVLGLPVQFDFLIRDAAFNELEGMRVNTNVTMPSGSEINLGIDESIKEIGEYTSEFTPVEQGLHKIKVTAEDDQDEQIGTLEQAFIVKEDHNEYEQAEYNPGLLKDISRSTGGEFFTLNQISQIPDAIPWEPGREAVTVKLHLWHHPLFLILLCLLLFLEWYFRRKKGLP